VVRSAVPKVFGILHLVFGGIGLVMYLFGLVMMVFRNRLQEMQFASYPEEIREQMKEAMQPMYATQSWDVVSSVGSLILAVFLLVAGFHLVKYRRKGLKVSNVYSVLSILHKLFAVAVVVFIKMPMMEEVRESLENIHGGSSAAMAAAMGPFAMIMGVLMVVLMMVYPVLSYIMLNKKQVKDSLM